MEHEPQSVKQEPEQQNGGGSENSDAGPSSNTEFVVGSMVGGRYKILGEIGRGGMGIVFKVEQVFLQEVCAFKLLQERHLRGKPMIRFQTEAQATNRLNHRNLISCKDFGLLEDNRPFLVMEYIQGITLEQKLKNQGALPIKEAIGIFLQVCDGLAYAHDHGIVHRDLKPSNIMLPDQPFDTKCDVVKILDFGIAKIVCDGDRQAVTATGEIFGSPYYMSPEQCMGKNIDLRTDIYALGCVLFEALTGLPPYSAETALATMMQHQSNTVPSLKQASLGGEFPQSLEQVVARLLAKDPAHRHQSMMAIKHDLQRILEDKDIHWAAETTAKKQNPSAKKAFALAAIIVVCFLVGMTLMRPAPISTSVSVKSPAPKARPLSGNDVAMAPTDEKFRPSSTYYAAVPLKDAKSGPWILDFPSESLGEVSLPPFAGKGSDGHNAKGTVRFSVPHAMMFTPSWPACEKPEYFRRFRADEIYSLDLSNMIDINDDLLFSFDHLTGLKGIFLVSTEISDQGLLHLKELPNLTDIRTSDSNITGVGLAKMKCIKRVEELWVDQTDNVLAVFKAIEGSTAIRYLSAKHDKLTNADMNYIRHMPNLQTLRLADNHITDAGLAKLALLKKLQVLDISECNITPASIPVLESFVHLTNLRITTHDWPAAKREELKKAFLGRTLGESTPTTMDD